jgi:hypothetical protein
VQTDDTKTTNDDLVKSEEAMEDDREEEEDKERTERKEEGVTKAERRTEQGREEIQRILSRVRVQISCLVANRAKNYFCKTSVTVFQVPTRRKNCQA